MIVNILYSFFLVFSLTLSIVAVIAYRKLRSAKILLVMIAFLFFFWKGILFTIQLFWRPLDEESLWILVGLLDLCILVLVFFAILKR
ncbi:MAG: hypothetical protein A2Z27_03350 [candidate division Zixibacteria bacterium RBG_16_50_21]|nr:MAG: hypothetical protein A2Z27_03350 [candidate division Zixibacteria bacterium RBG_16_50_21]